MIDIGEVFNHLNDNINFVPFPSETNEYATMDSNYMSYIPMQDAYNMNNENVYVDPSFYYQDGQSTINPSPSYAMNPSTTPVNSQSVPMNYSVKNRTLNYPQYQVNEPYAVDYSNLVNAYPEVPCTTYQPTGYSYPSMYDVERMYAVQNAQSAYYAEYMEDRRRRFNQIMSDRKKRAIFFSRLQERRNLKKKCHRIKEEDDLELCTENWLPLNKPISKKSTKSHWTKLTKELFSQMLEYEKTHTNVKQCELEKIFNVNRSTYWRWKKQQNLI